MKLLNTIRSRLVLTYLLLVSLSLGISAGFALRWMQASLERRAESQLMAQSRVLAHFMDMYTQHPDDLPESARWVMKRFPRLTRARIRIADAQGQVLGDSTASPGGTLPPDALAALQGTAITWHSTEGGVRVAHATTPIELEYPTLQRIGVVDVASNLSELDDTYQELQSQLLAALGLALAGSILAAVLLAATLTRPLERIRATAARIAEGHLEERVQPSGTRELSQLGSTINHMAEQLELQLAEIRSERDQIQSLLSDVRRLEEMRNLFLGSVSHELRTPLTIIKGFAATLRETSEDPGLARPLARIDTEADRLTRLVQDLLELTRLRSLSLSLELAPMVPEEVVEDVVELLRPQAEHRDLTLSYQPEPSPRPVPVDRDRLKQVVINLVDNALKFTPDGGTVSVRTRLAEGCWQLEVEDTGPGIPAEDLPLLFDHFFRSKDTSLRSVKGSGLGLAIVKEIVTRHGGTVGAESVAGQGTTLRVSLPA